jgi:hypothetical protein
MLRRLEAMSVCSPIAFSAHIHCRDTWLKAHAMAGAEMSNAHAGAIDALALDMNASCISLSSVDVPLALSRPMLNIIGEEQFHCFDAFTGSDSDSPYSDEYSHI